MEVWIVWIVWKVCSVSKVWIVWRECGERKVWECSVVEKCGNTEHWSNVACP